MRKFSKSLLFVLLSSLLVSSSFAYDRVDNPPGPRGGPGTNWENPPGPRGGPGASPDRRDNERYLMHHMSRHDWQRFQHMRMEERRNFCRMRHIHMDRCAIDRHDNPPGPRGGPGTNWENPPGPRGGPGASPYRP